MHDLRHPRLGLFHNERVAGSKGSRVCPPCVYLLGVLGVLEVRLSEQQSLDRGRLRAAGIEAHIGAEEPRQRERFQEWRWQLPQVDADLGTCLRDQGGRWHWPALRMMAKPEPARRLDGCPQFRVLR